MTNAEQYTIRNQSPPFNLTDTDRVILAQTDEEFEPHSWEELKEIDSYFAFSLGVNDLAALKRYPSQLRRYLTWSNEIKATYGSIPNFVCEERLHWSPSRIHPRCKASGLEPQSSVPFAHFADYKILRNDWPYAIPPEVVHLVIWSKIAFATTSLGHLLPEAQNQIQEFVDRTFVKILKDIHGDRDGGERVLWFKNWSALQSVGALEHFHCFIRDPGEGLLKKWTREEKEVSCEAD